MTAELDLNPADTKVDQEEVIKARQLLLFNQISALLAMFAGVYFYIWWIDSPWLIAAIVWQVVGFVGLDRARRRITADTLVSIGLLVLVWNWSTAVVLTAVAPFSYPLGILQIIIPILAGGPVLERRMLLRVLVGATILTGVVVGIGLALEDSELNDTVDEDLQDGILMIGVPIMTFAVAKATWDAHDRQGRRLRQERESAEVVRDSRSRLVHAADAERSRIERDLHDGAQQQLVALAMELRLLKSTNDLGDELDPLIADLESAMENLRELAHGIYPPLLRSRGLAEAIRAAAHRSPSMVDVDVVADRFDPAIEAAIYFCCLEALQNAAKHAGSGAAVIVRVEKDRSAVHGLIGDDGPGFDPAISPEAGDGLRNMEDRIVAVGGEFSVSGERGTEVRFIVPV